jgi:hypothetical protein
MKRILVTALLLTSSIFSQEVGQSSVSVDQLASGDYTNPLIKEETLRMINDVQNAIEPSFRFLVRHAINSFNGMPDYDLQYILERIIDINNYPNKANALAAIIGLMNNNYKKNYITLNNTYIVDVIKQLIWESNDDQTLIPATKRLIDLLVKISGAKKLTSEYGRNYSQSGSLLDFSAKQNAELHNHIKTILNKNASV